MRKSIYPEPLAATCLAAIVALAFLIAGCGGTKVTVSTSGVKKSTSLSTAPLSQSTTASQSTTPAGTVAGGTNILKNSDFAAGLSEWRVINQGGSRAHGVNKVDVVDGESGHKAVHMTRSCPENDGGASGLSQGLSATLKPGDRLVMSARVRADNEVGGALAGSDPRWFPEGPAQFRIFYEKINGEKAEWYHGFYYGDVPGADSVHFTRVAKGEWAAYTSPDIAGELGVGARITEFRVYGFGWDFDGYASKYGKVVTPS